MWTKNFQIFKLDLEKTEEPEIKLAISVRSQKKQKNSRKICISALLTMQKPLTVWIRTKYGTFKRWEYQTILPVSWEICMKVRKPQLQLDNRLVPNWERSTSRLYAVSCLFNFCAEYIMQNAGLDEAQARIKIVRRNINNLRYANDNTLMAESEEELKNLLMKCERGEWESWIKTQHSKI